MPKLCTKNALFWYFWDGIFKKYSLFNKFRVKVKMSKSRTNNTSGYFWVRIWKNCSPI